MIFTTSSEVETAEIGEKIGKIIKGGEVIALIGDLGGGKTQFTKGLAKAMGIADPVVSPTFTIERIYQGQKMILHHFDFYRLINVDQEIQEGIYDLLDDEKNVIVIEWAYNMEQVLPKDFLEVNFEYLGDNQRKIELVGHGEKSKSLIRGLK